MEKTKVSVEENRTKWLEKNGFNMNEKTYIYFPNDSYDKKEELKDAGFRFQKELLWHAAVVPTGYEDSCIEVSLFEVGEMTAWGSGVFMPEVRTYINKKIKSARPVVVSTSEWFGEVNKRFFDHEVTLVSIRNISTRYGDTQLVKFIDDDGNEFNWWTGVTIEPPAGSRVKMTATVKKHDTYEDVKITVVTRAKLTEI